MAHFNVKNFNFWSDVIKKERLDIFGLARQPVHEKCSKSTFEHTSPFTR